MKINYSKQAVADLKRLRDFIGENTPYAAQSISQKLLEKIKLLSDHPRLGKAVQHSPNPDVIRDLILGDYIIRYLISDTQIIILKVWHHRENWKDQDTNP